jgi:hypothetical protein
MDDGRRYGFPVQTVSAAADVRGRAQDLVSDMVSSSGPAPASAMVESGRRRV